jgi:flagellar protein FlaG
MSASVSAGGAAVPLATQTPEPAATRVPARLETVAVGSGSPPADQAWPSAIEVLRAELGDSLGEVNARLSERGQRLDIGVDPSTGAVVVKVSDDKTGEVVRQIPSEDALRVARNIEVLTGILVDHKE